MKPFFSTAPTLETERLRLRAFRLDDFASFDAVFQDPEESRFLGGMIPTGESWRKFVFNTGHWALMGFENGPPFTGRISDPIPLIVHPDGTLSIAGEVAP